MTFLHFFLLVLFEVYCEQTSSQYESQDDYENGGGVSSDTLFHVALIVFLVFICILSVSLLYFICRAISFPNKVKKLIREFLSHELDSPRKRKHVVRESDLEGLPEFVQKYLRFTQSVGTVVPRTISVRQKGKIKIKLDEGAKYSIFSGTQYYSTKSYNFIWLGVVNVFPFIKVYVKDSFYKSVGGCHVMMTSFLKLANVSKGVYDEASLVRYLNEIVWVAPSWLAWDKRIKFEEDEEDPKIVKLTIVDGSTTATETVHFNEDGSIRTCFADRYCESEKTKRLWETKFWGKTMKVEKGPRVQTGGHGYYYLPVEKMDEEGSSGEETGFSETSSDYESEDRFRNLERRKYIDVELVEIYYDDKRVL